MATFYEFSCSKCDFEARFSKRSGFYVLPDRAEVPTKDACGWCASCALATVETFPSVEALEARIRDVETDAPWVQSLAEIWTKHRANHEHEKRSLIASIRRSIVWRELRRSPPRCLHCGGHDFKVFWWHPNSNASEPLEHPGCGGQLVGRIAGHVRKLFKRYDAEGGLLEQ